MKPILVHVHIFYIPLWEEIKQCLCNIDRPYDLYITMVESHPACCEDILAFNKDAHIEVLENRGFDVGPFIHILNKVNLDEYSYIIKLHTKKTLENKRLINGLDFGADRWRKCLLMPFSNKKHFEKALDTLDRHPKIGMCGYFKTIIVMGTPDVTATRIFREFLKKNGLPRKCFHFIAGTMFIARAELFKILQTRLSLADFPVSTANTTQLAHALERFFGYLVYYQNQKIYMSLSEKIRMLLPTLWGMIYQDHITKSNRRLIKFCKIPVYSKIREKNKEEEK